MSSYQFADGYSYASPIPAGSQEWSCQADSAHILFLDICRLIANTPDVRIGIQIMDWMFYLIVFLALFSLIATLLSIRFLLGKRLEKMEEKRQMEEEARQTAESNSGL